MKNRFDTVIAGFLLCSLISLAQADPTSAPPKPGVLTRTRFFAMPGHEQDLVGGKIVASNDPTLPNEESNGLPISIDKFAVQGVIKTAPAPGQWGELPIENNTTPYRWIAYAAPSGSHGRIAEIEFYSGNRKLSGAAFNAWAPEHVSRYATDGKIATYYNSEYADNQFAGLDIGVLASGPSPTVSPAEGEYKDTTNVTISRAKPGAVIRYTLDGTLPTAKHGELYTAPIPILKTSTITAIAFNEGLAPTPPTYSTYIIGSTIPHTSSLQIGNSLTQVGGSFDRQAFTGGHVNHDVIWGIGGAPTRKLWDAAMTPDVDPSYKEYNDRWSKQWPTLTSIDFFTMQPRDFDIPEEADYDIRWMNFVRQKAPAVQPWLYIEWTEMARKRPTDLGAEPTSEMQKVWPAATWEESMAAMVLYGEDLERKIKETYQGDKAPRVLPTALAMGWFHHQIENGEFPGTKPDDFYPRFFRDQVHPNADGAFLVVCTWYAAFFGESPEGKILPIHTDLTAGQAQTMERIAWDAVSNYPDCGYYKEGAIAAGKPEFSQAPAPIKDVTPVTMTSSTPGAWFRYTLDGTTPTRTNGYIYCGVVSARPGMTIKAIAYKSGMADSPVTGVTYPLGR
jgi:hypothetical protein